MDEFPEKIVQLDQIRINRNLKKECNCSIKRYVVDTTNKRIFCQGCGTQVDPYDAMLDLANRHERINEDLQRLHEQRKQLLDYKPWLLTIRNLEKRYRGKKSLPCCPRCNKPFYLEELKTWISREWADKLIRKFQQQNN